MSNVIIENNLFLTTDQKTYIDTNILSNNIPWFFSEDSVYQDQKSYFSHVLIHRVEDKKNLESNSPHTPFFIEILKNICADNNINFSEILRASLNTTFSNNDKFGTVHLDHEFDHMNCILYLSSIENAGTLIFENDQKSIAHKSSCIKYRYLLFPGLYHAQLFPPAGARRIVFVATFR
jgi:hypothetical protein